MIKKTALIISSAFILGACSYSPKTPSGSAQTQATGDITIQQFAFSPKTVTVKAGQTVTITNKDSAPHTVTSDIDGSFDSGSINSGQTGSFTAPSVAGVYSFHCNIHKSMTATLVVQ